MFTQVVLVGDSEGEVNVYLLKNIPAPPTTDQVRFCIYYVHECMLQGSAFSALHVYHIMYLHEGYHVPTL